MTKERYQNPALGDDIKLRLISFNSNLLTDLESVDKVDIYYYDPLNCELDCADKRTLVESFTSGVVREDTGKYYLTVSLTAPKYTIGKYADVWTVTTKTGEETVGSIVQSFQVFPNLWYFSTMPPVYSFDFYFQPNRIRQGSNKWLIIKIVPNVPRATDLEKYYTNLAISSTLKIYMQKACGECPTDEDDLIIDGDLVEQREKVFGYYKLDTSEMSCGIFDIWFTLEFAEVVEVSPKMQLQVF